jgi:hypothetical protein
MLYTLFWSGHSQFSLYHAHTCRDLTDEQFHLEATAITSASTHVDCYYLQNLVFSSLHRVWMRCSLNYLFDSPDQLFPTPANYDLSTVPDTTTRTLRISWNVETKHSALLFLSHLIFSLVWLITPRIDWTQLYGVVVRAPDFVPRGPRFETREHGGFFTTWERCLSIRWWSWW